MPLCRCGPGSRDGLAFAARGTEAAKTQQRAPPATVEALPRDRSQRMSFARRQTPGEEWLDVSSGAVASAGMTKS